MDTLRLLNEYGKAYQIMMRAIYSCQEKWLLDTVIEKIIHKKIEHKNLTIPENADWHLDKIFTAFLYRVNNDVELHNIIEGGSLANVVGHLQENESVKNKFEVKQDCSFLYFFIGNLYKKDINISWTTKTMCLMKLFYEGIKKEKISDFPDDFGFYVFAPKTFYEDVNQLKETLKNEVCNKMNSYFYESPLGKTTIIKPEEFTWFCNNIDEFIDKLNIKQFSWMELIASIVDPKIKTELSRYYFEFIKINQSA